MRLICWESYGNQSVLRYPVLYRTLECLIASQGISALIIIIPNKPAMWQSSLESI